MQASNEELQATNEELHASNEELQATNEELLTVNEELEQKSLELAFLIEDLENIENSIDSPLLVADSRGLLRHMNEDARRLLGLTTDQLGGPVIIPNDAGFATQLTARIQTVISFGQSAEIRQEINSCHYRVRLRPYQGRHKAHSGVVIVFRDVTSLVKINGRLRRSETRLRRTTEWRQATFNAVPTELAVLDAHGKIVEVNDAWRRFAEQNQLPCSKRGIDLNYLDNRPSAACSRRRAWPKGCGACCSAASRTFRCTIVVRHRNRCAGFCASLVRSEPNDPVALW